MNFKKYNDDLAHQNLRRNTEKMKSKDSMKMQKWGQSEYQDLNLHQFGENYLSSRGDNDKGNQINKINQMVKTKAVQAQQADKRMSVSALDVDKNVAYTNLPRRNVKAQERSQSQNRVITLSAVAGSQFNQRKVPTIQENKQLRNTIHNVNQYKIAKKDGLGINRQKPPSHMNNLSIHSKIGNMDVVKEPAIKHKNRISP